MFSEIILGILFGLITGLIPGIHPNNIVQIIEFLQTDININIASVVVLTAIIYSFVSFIPSTVLAVSDENSSLSIPPSQKMYLEGRSFEATVLTVIGGLTGALISVAILPLIKLISIIRPLVIGFLKYIYVLVLIVLILRSKNKKYALISIILSTIVWILVDFCYLPRYLSIAAVFIGFFGLSNVLLLLKSSSNVKQKIEFPSIEIPLKDSILGVLISILMIQIPNLTVSQSAIILSLFTKINGENFLIVLGSATTALYILSLGLSYFSNYSKTGVIYFISKKMNGLTYKEFISLLGVSLIGVSVGAILTIFIAKYILSKYNRVEWLRKISIIAISTISTGFIAITSGFTGILLLLVSTSLGIFAQIKNVEKTLLVAGSFAASVLYMIFF